MEEELKELETELCRLSPAPVPEALETRIFDSLSSASEPEENKIVGFPVWRRLGAAAAVAIGCTGVYFAALNSFAPKGGGPVASPTPPPMPVGSTVPADRSFVPASAENTFRGVSDGGMFLNRDGMPVRELRYQFNDSFRWTDPKDGTELELVIPHERSYLVPVPTD